MLFGFVAVHAQSPTTADSLWSTISLTGEHMKPNNKSKRESKFPWIPVVIGAAGAGTAAYFLTRDEDEVVDCKFSVSQQVTDASCGQSNGAIILSPFPGDTYSFVWSNGSTASQLANIPPGAYSVTITRGQTGCQEIFDLVVNNTATNIGANANVTEAECGQNNGAATITVSSTGSFTYAWSNGASGASQQNLAPGNYSVTVTGGGDCQQVVNFTIQESGSEFTASSTSTPAHCGLEDGSIAINVDPPGNYTYQWSNGNTGSEDASVAAGNYTITVSINGTSCQQIINVNVEELSSSFSASINTTETECGQASGTAIVTVTPDGDYTYQWSNGGSGNTQNNLAAGDYTVTVSITGTTCSTIVSGTVTESEPSFILNTSSTASSCGASNGSATVDVIPAGTYDYAWSNGSTEASINNVPAGTYTVTVSTAGTQCSKTVDVTVTDLPANIQISFTTTSADCGASNGSATITVTPPGAYTYAWSNGNTTETANNLSAGSYQVTVTETGTSCSKDTTITILQSQVNFTATLTSTPAHCGLSDGSATITVTPPGIYTYLWENGETGTTANNLPVGTIGVTVTDNNSCSSAFNVTVELIPISLITVDSTSGANCLGGGDIHITLSTPGAGPLVVQIVSPEDTMVLNLEPGSYAISEISTLNIIPGSYTIEVYDLVIGAPCTDLAQATVENIDPELIANDDLFNTSFNTPLSENVLTNDIGLDVQLSGIHDVNNGTVTFDSTGAFVFTPDNDFAGEASFTYTITDACGNTSEALVTILVNEGVCDFTITPSFTPASCGIADGTITVAVNGPNTYTYAWSNGDTGPTADQLSPGNYSVIITDTEFNCSLSFSFDLPQAPINHIDNLVVTQPACNEDGEISFIVFTSGGQSLAMTVEHPNGNDQFLIVPGTIQLSDYVPIQPGIYNIDVFNTAAGPSCAESITVQIFVGTSVQITIMTINPPSTENGNDGSILVNAFSPGQLPYTILLNGANYGTANSHMFTVEGLSVGQYTIQIVDAAGCESNTIMFGVPPPTGILAFGTGVVMGNVSSTIPEHGTDNTPMIDYVLTSSLILPTQKNAHEISVAYSPAAGQNLTIDYYTNLGKLKLKNFDFKLQGGVGVHHGQRVADTYASDDLYHWSVKGSFNHSIPKVVDLQAFASIGGWDKIGTPMYGITMKIKTKLGSSGK